ncbi:hypothetical protein [Kribbella deserti]|uniref:Uncharacterized protein n=1 Tax=Kribbella deserti TaxID=1926257 RepID=A0ABV6QGT5_9ACTN
MTSYPFDNQDTSETQYSHLFRELADTGIADTHAGTGFKVAAGSGMSITIQPGFAIVRGHAISSTAVETLSLPAPASSPQTHLIVLRLNPALNAITLAVVAGTPGTGTPALTQTDAGVFEFPLANVPVAGGAVNVDGASIVDRREFLGARVGAWTTATRPANRRKYKIGFNATLGGFEYWTGTEWRYLVEPNLHARVAGLETQPYAMRTGPMRANAMPSFTSGAWHDIDWREELGASGITFHAISGIFTILSTGRYLYTLTITFDHNRNGSRYLQLRNHANDGLFAYASIPANPGGWTSLTLTGEHRFTAGTKLVAALYQDSGATVPLVEGGAYQKLVLRRIGA